MKIKVKDIEFNPFRNVEKYPVDKLKVEALKNSIEETGFWDNILARPFNNHYQISYGHHRIIAVRELGIEEIDIPVKNLSDADMIRIMANENMNDWQMTPSIVYETIRATRDFLDAELAKYENWEEAKKVTIFSNLFGNEKNPIAGFGQAKGKQGVGQTVIKNFLGRNWKRWVIEEALSMIDSKDIDIKATEVFKSLRTATQFKKAVKKINEEKPESIPIKDQIKLAKKINKRIENKDVRSLGDSFSNTMDIMVRQEVDKTDEFDATLKNLIIEIKNITKESEKLTSKIGSLNGKLNDMGVQDLKSIHSVFVLNSFSQLFINTTTFLDYLGFKFNNLQIEKNEKSKLFFK